MYLSKIDVSDNPDPKFGLSLESSGNQSRYARRQNTRRFGHASAMNDHYLVKALESTTVEEGWTSGGRAFVYSLDLNNPPVTWASGSPLTPPRDEVDIYDRFGSAVAIDSSHRIFVGAPTDATRGWLSRVPDVAYDQAIQIATVSCQMEGTGFGDNCTYSLGDPVAEMRSGSCSRWPGRPELLCLSSQAVDWQYFGHGAVHIFARENDGNNWRQKLMPLNPVLGENFGESIAVRGNRSWSGLRPRGLPRIPDRMTDDCPEQPTSMNGQTRMRDGMNWFV